MKIAVIGEFRLPAGAFDDARPVMRTMLEATRAGMHINAVATPDRMRLTRNRALLDYLRGKLA